MEEKPKRKRGRKKKDLDILIDGKNVDIHIVRKDGVTDIEVETPIIDVDIHKEPGEKLEIDAEVKKDGMLKLALDLLRKKYRK